MFTEGIYISGPPLVLTSFKRDGSVIIRIDEHAHIDEDIAVARQCHQSPESGDAALVGFG
jgi:hypothetical protein